MTMNCLDPGQLEQLRSIGTCIVASAIEVFGVRLQNTGFASSRVHCMFPNCPPIVGYAATARIRSAQPPMDGRNYYRRTDWWNHILSIPAPRVVVIEDVDDPPGVGAFVGAVNANILMALGCTALITNGAVRDLREVETTGFQMFAGNVSVSHAYAHVFDFGGEVEMAGLKIRPGALLHGDRHGVLTVPIEIASKVPAAAHEIIQRRQQLIGLCKAPNLSMDDLRIAIDDTTWRERLRTNDPATNHE
jgi:regulator of RNase E activity RraA